MGLLSRHLPRVSLSQITTCAITDVSRSRASVAIRHRELPGTGPASSPTHAPIANRFKLHPWWPLRSPRTNQPLRESMLISVNARKYYYYYSFFSPHMHSPSLESKLRSRLDTPMGEATAIASPAGPIRQFGFAVPTALSNEVHYSSVTRALTAADVDINAAPVLSISSWAASTPTPAPTALDAALARCGVAG
jgi:hypothetical protein